MDESLREQLARIYAETKTIAVVGISRYPFKPSQRIPKYLQEQGYRILPVNPRGGSVLEHGPSHRPVVVAWDLDPLRPAFAPLGHEQPVDHAAHHELDVAPVVEPEGVEPHPGHVLGGDAPLHEWRTRQS
jgi:hypothetical protein